MKVIDELMSKHVLKKSTPPPLKKKKKRKKILAQVYCVIGWVGLYCKCVIDGTVELLTKKKCQRKGEQNVQSFVNHSLTEN